MRQAQTLQLHHFTAQPAAHLEISKEHADKFSDLLVQGFDGRIEPMNSQALDVLRKK